MTCIVGLKTEEGVYIGEDSCSTSGNVFTADAVKVFAVGDFMFSSCGTARGNDIIKHCFTPPKKTEEQTTENYIHSTVVASLRSLFKEQGFAKTENEKENHDNVFIFSYRGRLFHSHGDYCMSEHMEYTASGSGREPALGSLFSTKKSKLTPKERVEEAIRAAANFNPYVREPILVEFQGV